MVEFQKATRQQIILALKANDMLPKGIRKTARELAAELGIEPVQVYGILNRLRKSGLAAGTSHVGQLPKEASPESEAADELLAKVLRGELVTREDRLAALSKVIATGTDLSKIQASRLMEDMENVTLLRTGPPPPSTDTETISRIYRVLISAPRALSETAIDQWRTYVKAAQASETPTD